MKARNPGRLIVTVITTLLISNTCYAYEDEGFQFWFTANASFDIDTNPQTPEKSLGSIRKDWKITVEENFRLGDDGGNLYYQHSDLGLVYKGLADWIDLSVNYRLVLEKDNNDRWRRENRPHLNITLKGRLFNLDLSNRARLEYRDRENKEGIWRYTDKVTLKLPLELELPLTHLKLEPYLAGEVFIYLGESDFHKNRLYSGVSFKLSKTVKGEIYYLWQNSRSSQCWKDINVIGTKLKFYF